jgi:hypothetical protein
MTNSPPQADTSAARDDEQDARAAVAQKHRRGLIERARAVMAVIAPFESCRPRPRRSHARRPC